MQEGKKLEETDLGAALTAAPFQAALDVTAGRLIPGIGKIFGAAGKKITPDVAKKIAEQGLGKAALDYGVKTGTVATAEGLTEAGQQLLERLQAGLDIQSPEARDEYFQSFLGGAVLGGTLGVPGRYFERRGIIAEGEKLKREEADKQAAKELADKEEQEKVKQAQEEFAKIAAEQKPPALTEEQIATMRGEVDSQRGVLNRELDRLRTQAKATPDVDEYLKISEQADKLQAGLDELDPDKVKTQINKIAKENSHRLEVLYTQSHNWLSSVAYNISKDKDVADDLVGELYLYLAEKCNPSIWYNNSFNLMYCHALSGLFSSFSTSLIAIQTFLPLSYCCDINQSCPSCQVCHLPMNNAYFFIYLIFNYS